MQNPNWSAHDLLSEPVVFKTFNRKMNGIQTNRTDFRGSEVHTSITRRGHYGSFILYKIKSYAFIAIPNVLSYKKFTHLDDSISDIFVRGDYNNMLIMEARKIGENRVMLSGCNNSYHYEAPHRNTPDRRIDFGEIIPIFIKDRHFNTISKPDGKLAIMMEVGITKNVREMACDELDAFLSAFIIPMLMMVNDIPDQSILPRERCATFFTMYDTLNNILGWHNNDKFNSFNQHIVNDYGNLLYHLIVDTTWKDSTDIFEKKIIIEIKYEISKCLELVKKYNSLIPKGMTNKHSGDS